MTTLVAFAIGGLALAAVFGVVLIGVRSLTMTQQVVTGTAVWLLSDGFAAKAALDSLSAYLAESEHPGEAEPAPVEAERRIKAAGGSRIYVDNSQRVQYASTRAFYESCGYRLETVLKDFYTVGDGKAIYCKSLI